MNSKTFFPMRRFSSVFVLSLAAVTLLSACGYQLRGWTSEQAFVSLAAVYLDNDSGDSQLGREVERSIVLGGGRVVTGPDEAEAHLRLDRLEQSHRMVTSNAQGQATEYGVRYSFQYHFQVGEDLPLVEDAIASGTYSYDPAQANVSSKQRRLLERRLRTEAVQAMLRNIRLYWDSRAEDTVR